MLTAVVRHDADNAILEDVVDVRRAARGPDGRPGGGQRRAPRTRADHRQDAELDAQLDDATAYLKADVAFHDAIMAASRNPVGAGHDPQPDRQAYRSLRYVGDPTPDHIKLTNQAHQLVHDAVMSGDAEKAQRAMDEHILASWQRRAPQSER